jgi:hypothetical protein
MQRLLFQAEELANYKPTLDVRKLLSQLKEMQETVRAAMEMLEGTRHRVIFYEDVVSDAEVRFCNPIMSR